MAAAKKYFRYVIIISCRQTEVAAWLVQRGIEAKIVPSDPKKGFKNPVHMITGGNKVIIRTEVDIYQILVQWKRESEERRPVFDLKNKSETWLSTWPGRLISFEVVHFSRKMSRKEIPIINGPTNEQVDLFSKMDRFLEKYGR